MISHFTSLHEAGATEVSSLVDLALELKNHPLQSRPLAGKSVALCFMNPSLRTQVSFEVAAASLGAHPVTLVLGSGAWKLEARDGVVMDGNAAEHTREAVPVLSRMCDAVALRSFASGKNWQEDRQDPYLNAFKRHSTVPLISMESAMGHPCQALADMMTLRERMNPRGKNFLLAWAPHVKALPPAVPHSAIEMAALAGMNVTIARPAGYDLDVDVGARVKKLCAQNGATFKTIETAETGYDGADVVYAKAWGSLSNYGAPPPADQSFRDAWRVTPEKMKLTNDAVFMHCLPARRNLIVDDEVLDSPAAIVIDQAENRLHTAKAVLLRLLAPEFSTHQEVSCPIPSTL